MKKIRWMMPAVFSLILLQTERITVLLSLFVFFVFLLLMRRMYIEACIVTVFSFIKVMMLRNGIPDPPAQLDGTVSVLRNRYYILHMKQQDVLVYNTEGIVYDDRVCMACSLKPVTSLANPSAFSFEQYSHNRGIYYACYYPKDIQITHGFSLRAALFKSLSRMDPDTAAIVKKYLFHIYESGGSDLAGTLLSAGMHVSMILSVLRKTLNRFISPKKTRFCMSGVTLFLLFFFHFDPMSVRLMTRNLLGYTELKSRDRWGITALAVLLFYPGLAGEMSVILPLSISFVHCFTKKHKFLYTNAACIMAQLYTRGYIYLSGLLYMPLLRPLFSLCFALSSLRIIIPLDLPLRFLDKIAAKILSFELPSFLLVHGKMALPVFLCGMILLALCAAQESLKRGLAVLLLLAMVHFQNFFLPFPVVTYLDVGQGDAALIRLGLGRGNFMIDTGGLEYTDLAENVLFPVLSSYGIGKLDLVCVSHSDYDHCGALDHLTELIKIKMVVREKQQEYRIGKLVMTDMLYPLSYEEANADSLTQYFTIYGTSFLFLGDIGLEQERDIVNRYSGIHADFVKLAHHGSASSSGDALLSSFLPDMAVISSGKDNPYGHPALPVLERLNGYRIPYLNTAENGAVTVTLFPGGYLIHTERGGSKLVFHHRQN